MDRLCWDAFHEGLDLKSQLEDDLRRYGYYPQKVLGDLLYGSRDNRRYLNSIFLVMDLLILLRIFFVLRKKAFAAAILPILRLRKMLLCHRQRRPANRCVLSQMPAP